MPASVGCKFLSAAILLAVIVDWVLDFGTPTVDQSGIYLKEENYTTTTPTTTPTTNGTETDEPRGHCPQLTDAHDYVLGLEHMIGNNESTAHPFQNLSILMVQLVGTWNDVKVSEVMQRVYEHNSKVVGGHGIPSLAITALPNDDEHTIIHEKELSPAYWKMNLTRHLCTTNGSNRTTHARLPVADGEQQPPLPDLLYFLDADIVLMDPTVRVDALWMYRRSKRQKLQLLFASDQNGLNSGTFLVNCSSPEAMDYLRLWDVVALDLARRNNTVTINRKWHDQNALHYLRQSTLWKLKQPNFTWDSIEEHEYYEQKLRERVQSETSSSGITDPGNSNNDTRDKTISDRNSDVEVTSSTLVPSSSEVRKRIVNAEPCALHTIVKKDRPQLAAADNNVLYMPGHYAAHAAGLSAPEKLSKLIDLLEQADQSVGPDRDQHHPLGLIDASRLYKQTHDETYSPSGES